MSLLNHTPQINAETAISLAYTLYQLQTTAAPLPSERDQNFLLHSSAGQRYVLKIANALEDPALLAAQQQAMSHVAAQVALCQRVIPTQAGQMMSQMTAPTGAAHWVWLVTYLDGTPLGETKWQSAVLHQNLGRCLGRVDRALVTFDHPAIHRHFHWDLANGLQIVEQYEGLIQDAELRRVVSKITAVFRQHTLPLLPHLRQSAIHNDANDYNLLVGGGHDLYTRHQQITGLIDFGDIVHSYTVGELAIGVAYAMLGSVNSEQQAVNRDVLAVAGEVARGYHAEYPLTEDEVAALFGLVCLRLCVSACMAAYQQQQRPEDGYLSISQAAIRQILPHLATIQPRLATAVLRHACGFSPVPTSQAIVNWLQTRSFAPIVGLTLQAAPVFDLSIGSPLAVGQTSNLPTEPELTSRLFGLMAEHGAQVGIGRYDEPRLIYTTPTFTTPTGEQRTIHLGLDLFAAPETAVFAPLPGTIHAFANNAAPQDYGPVIILQHHTETGEVFYTLYGHLSLDSLAGLAVGQSINAGQIIGKIGTASINGGWTPHLHFQLITDLLELGTEFPGVAPASQRQVWCSLSPDPNLIVGVPAQNFPPLPPLKTETLTVRRQKIGRNLSIGYREPVKVLRGWKQYLYDENGRQYLDAYNNVPHVGHCHPHVVRAGQQQMAVLNTNTRYLHDYINEYAKNLCATLPEPLQVCFFVNSASEANELALRLARVYTRQQEMIVLEAAYHGHTNTLIDISPYKHAGPGGGGAPPWVHTAPIPDVYRGPHKADDPQAGVKYAAYVQEIIGRLLAQGKGLAGYIAETCPSVGGQIFLPDGYLAAVYTLVRAAGGVCIADEVQTGYGRIGTHFYAFQAHGVVPDIVVLGKPIGNGHPIGAVITTPAIADAFHNGMEFFSTFGGNTVSCAVGLAVLEVMEREKLQAHALRVGERLLEGIRPFLFHYPLVGDVRGSGLFLGVELVRNRHTLEPAAAEASFVAEQMRQQGILLGTDGPYHNVVKIRPPMPFNEEDADRLVTTLERVLQML